MNIGFLNLLTIVFVVMKLLGFFHFSWFVAFLPTIIDIAIIIICFFIVVLTGNINKLHIKK